MASSASSSTTVPPALLLPLIPCPYCGDKIVSYVARRSQHPGTRFYKCCHHDDGDCDFYEWQPVYAARTEVAAAIATHVAPVQGPADVPVPTPPVVAAVQVTPPAGVDGKPHPTCSHASPPRNQGATGLAGAYAAHLPLANIMLSVANLMVSVLVLAVVLAVMVKLYFE